MNEQIMKNGMSRAEMIAMLKADGFEVKESATKKKADAEAAKLKAAQEALKATQEAEASLLDKYSFLTEFINKISADKAGKETLTNLIIDMNVFKKIVYSSGGGSSTRAPSSPTFQIEIGGDSITCSSIKDMFEQAAKMLPDCFKMEVESSKSGGRSLLTPDKEGMKSPFEISTGMFVDLHSNRKNAVARLGRILPNHGIKLIE